MDTRNPSFFTLLLIISFAAVNAVMFTPALPLMADDFAISADLAQQTVTVFLIGYALGQLFYSPMANRYGRKPALYLGISIQIVASLFCVLAGYLGEFSLLVVARFFAALGSGVGLKMTFTIINECYEPKVASKKIAYTTLAFSTMPGLSVALGGFITKNVGWEACFYAGAVYGLVLLCLTYRLPETLKERDLHALAWHKIRSDYAKEFTNPSIVLGGMLMGCCGAFVYSFAALAPFIAIKEYGMTAASYGMANMIPLVGMTLGALSSARATQRRSLATIIRFGLLFVWAGVISMWVATRLSDSIYVGLFLPTIVVYFGAAHILPNASSIALSTVHNKSHASAVINFISMSFVTLTLLVVSAIDLPPSRVLMGFYCFVAMMALSLYLSRFRARVAVGL